MMTIKSYIKIKVNNTFKISVLYYIYCLMFKKSDTERFYKVCEYKFLNLHGIMIIACLNE